MMHKLAESGLRVPACATLLSRMETSPSQGEEVPVLADRVFEDMFLADTWARLGRGLGKESMLTWKKSNPHSWQSSEARSASSWRR